VVAESYRINDTVIVPPDGIDELIDATNRLMPEGKMAAEKDVAAFKLRRKRAMANGLIGTFTTAGATVGAFPMPVADAVVLSTLEATEVNALASVYEIRHDENSKEFLSTIIEMGTVSIAARAAISAIKSIPGINIAASVLDAIIAGSFVAAIGQASSYAFEQVYLGEKTLDDLDWLRKLFESELSNDFVDKAGSIVKQVSGVDVPLFEAKMPFWSLLKGMDRQQIVNLVAEREDTDRYPGLMVGSVDNANNNAGNWE
jgi:uncharacterized protein (DUF697 family)